MELYTTNKCIDDANTRKTVSLAFFLKHSVSALLEKGIMLSKNDDNETELSLISDGYNTCFDMLIEGIEDMENSLNIADVKLREVNNV